MRVLISLSFLLIFASTQQVTHIHLDTESGTVHCDEICVYLAVDDVLQSAEIPELQSTQSFLTRVEKLVTGYQVNNEQRARSPPVHL